MSGLQAWLTADHAVLLQGGPGIGKSCMVNHALKQMTSGGASEYHTIAFNGRAPVSQLLTVPDPCLAVRHTIPEPMVLRAVQ